MREAETRLTNTQLGEDPKVLKSNRKDKVFFGELTLGAYVIEAGAEGRIEAKSEVLSIANPRDALDLTFKLPEEEVYRKVEEAGNEAHSQHDYREARKQYQKAVDMAHSREQTRHSKHSGAINLPTRSFHPPTSAGRTSSSQPAR